MSERTALYRFFDADGKLLYIGISRDPHQRFKSHRRRAWWSKVDTREIEWFDTREEAELAEGAAVRAEAPAHNRAGTGPDPTPSGKAVGRPKWKGNAEQQAQLDRAAAASQAATEARTRFWEAFQRCRNAGIPTAYLIEQTGVSRATVYRKLGALA